MERVLACFKCGKGFDWDEESKGHTFEDTDEVRIWYCQACYQKKKVKIPIKWQRIGFVSNEDETAGCETARTKVIGGWVMNTSTYSEYGVSEASVFIPDPQHTWEI